MKAPISELAKRAIVYHARQCEAALRCAAAAADFGLGKGMDEGFRRLAVYHSSAAFDWLKPRKVSP